MAECDDGGIAQSLLWREGNELCLRLRTRKNMQCGSGVLRRGCCCHRASAQAMCPVHQLWDEFLADRVGSHPWSSVTAASARSHLRCTLESQGVVGARSYGLHDFRRGCAKASRPRLALLRPALAVTGHAEGWLQFSYYTASWAVAQCRLHEIP